MNVRYCSTSSTTLTKPMKCLRRLSPRCRVSGSFSYYRKQLQTHCQKRLGIERHGLRSMNPMLCVGNCHIAAARLHKVMDTVRVYTHSIRCQPRPCLCINRRVALCYHKIGTMSKLQQTRAHWGYTISNIDQKKERSPTPSHQLPLFRSERGTGQSIRAT
jgi:hypothetical protein